ncbi:MAG: DUF3253 domain-containing protein [Alphaproteobacteria bacterium]
MSTKPKFPNSAKPKTQMVDDEQQETRSTLYQVIIELTRAAGPNKSVTAQQVAQSFRPPQPDEKPGEEVWRKIVRQVRAEAVGLARKGHVDIVRKGEVIDPAVPFKGLYKIKQKPE